MWNYHKRKEEHNIMIYWQLFYEFFKIGLFSIGGGLATLPFFYELADKYSWFSREMLINMIAISESTPGPIGVNMATNAGYSAGGIGGGIIATLALITPSIFIIMFIVKILDNFKENHFVQGAFYGLRPAVTALIASAAIGIFKIAILNMPLYSTTGNLMDAIQYKQLILFFLLVFATNKFSNIHSVYFIGASAVVGVIFKF